MNTPTFALIGNPNCGKTTLFNALTGSRQHTGNWPGVTVERKEGRFDYIGRSYRLIDLPGTYALDDTALSEDERIARDYVLGGEAKLVAMVLDAANLERGLYLAVQLAEVGLPMLVVLNRVDVAASRGRTVDAAVLQARLGCPIVTTVAHRLQGIEALKATMVALTPPATAPVLINYPSEVEQALAILVAEAKPQAVWPTPRWLALESLQGRADGGQSLGNDVAADGHRLRQAVEAQTGEDVDILIADSRYNTAREIARTTLHEPDPVARTPSDRIDEVVLHRRFGIPIFLAAMYLLFLFSINLAEVFIGLCESLAGAIFVHHLGDLITALGGSPWLRLLIADGIGGGIQVVATFIPIIGFLYLFLSLLEDSGYMARAAFVMDRAMTRFGLPGKAFVPLIVGFGCNVPAIMAARTLDTPRERILTALLAPFMSCGARLAVYTLFIAAFFPHHGANLAFILYLVGILAAALTAFLLKGTLLPGETQPFVMELPSYQWPTWRGIALRTGDRLRGFVLGAGQVIVVMVLVLNVLGAVSLDGRLGEAVAPDESLLADVGRAVTPVLAPLGIDADNWPATVGLLTGILAKEVVVGTLDTLYGQLASVSTQGAVPIGPWQQVGDALATIPAALWEMMRHLGDPLGLRVVSGTDPGAELEIDEATFGAMVSRFDGTAGAFAYLLFVLLYFPCASTVATLAREIGPRWALFSVLWSTALGFTVATAFYQLATLPRHPLGSLAWLIGLASISTLAIWWLHRYSRRQDLALPTKPTGYPGPLIADGSTTCRHCG